MFSGRFGELLLILLIILLLFGAGKIPRLMSDMGKGLRMFRAGLDDEGQQNEDDEPNVLASTKTKKPTANGAKKTKTQSGSTKTSSKSTQKHKIKN